MTGIFYDPRRRRLQRVDGCPEPDWTLVTHDLTANAHRCRRVLRELLPPEELRNVDYSLVSGDPAVTRAS